MCSNVILEIYEEEFWKVRKVFKMRNYNYENYIRQFKRNKIENKMKLEYSKLLNKVN